MKIAVISDSHNKLGVINDIIPYLEDVDMVLHCGDGIEDLSQLKDVFKGKIHGVSGNCDFVNDFPNEIVIEVNNKKIFMCHGNHYNVKSSYNNILYKGIEMEADIILFGHTHVGIINEFENCILMNPGSLSITYGNVPKSLGYIEISDSGRIQCYLKKLKN